MSTDRIEFSINGVHYETLEATLQRFPKTLLGSPNTRGVLCKSSSSVLTVQCNTCTFDAILFYYQSNGMLIKPFDLSVTDFEAHCRFFAIDENDIRKMKEREGYVVPEIQAEPVFSIEIQRKLWQFLDSPHSSKVTQFYALLNSLLIMSSIALACVQTLPQLKHLQHTPSSQDHIFRVDLSFNSIFICEFLARFVVSPNKKTFLFSFINVIDFLAILPPFVLQIVSLFKISTIEWLQVLRTLRILRLLRLGKQSRRLEFVFRILSTCLVDVLTMILAVLISSVFYGSLVYYAEQTTSDETQFTSIPQSLWWAVQTIIPLGYGDIVPRTFLGKIVAGMVCILAAFSFTVPVLFLGGKFLGLYSKNFGTNLGDDFKSCDAEH